MNTESNGQSQESLASASGSTAEPRLPFKAWRIGRLLLTHCNQAHGAPMMDDSTSRDADGHRYKGKAILLKPWRKNGYGEHLPQPAVVIAWRR